MYKELECHSVECISPPKPNSLLRFSQAYANITLDSCESLKIYAFFPRQFKKTEEKYLCSVRKWGKILDLFLYLDPDQKSMVCILG